LASIATGVATGDYSSAVGSGLTIGGFQESGGDIDFGVIIQALKSNTATNLLSTPSIMTMDNQEAEIVVGQNVPFVTGQTSSSTNTNPFTTITREDVGVTLKVIPHIHDGQAIRLEVEATAESVSNTTVAGSADLITNKRSIKTMILSDDRETIVLGGLIRDDVREVVSKVPLLGDIPLLGWLFRSKSTNQVKSNLMVFLRATIVSDAGIAKNLTQDKFNGIWEFTVSEELAADDSNIKMERLFDGLPLKK
jgi:general secretion pathway protein D